MAYHQNQADPTTQHQTVFGSEVAGPAATSQSGFGHSAAPYNHFDEVQRSEKTILDVEGMQPEGAPMISPPKPVNHSILQPEDLGPLEFTPDLGQTRKNPIGLADKRVLAEMFDWSETDTAVVKSLHQQPSPVSGNATAGYFPEAPRVDNKRSTQKASAIQRGAMVWDSETNNGG